MTSGSAARSVCPVGGSRWDGSTFLGRLDADDLAALLEAGHRRQHRAGEVLLREGEPPSSVIVVLAGTVKVTKAGTSGREVLLELRSAGDVVGELGAVDGAPRSATVLTLGEVDAVTVAADRFDRLLRERAGVAHAVLATVVHRLRRSAARQLEFGTLDVVGRVCARIAELAVDHGEPGEGGVVIRRSISQQDLADWAAVSRDGVVRALAELRSNGWVETGRHRIVVRELELVSLRAGSRPG